MKTAAHHCQSLLVGALALLNAECIRRGLESLDVEQIEALADEDQVFDMLHDMEDRCGMEVGDARALVTLYHVEDESCE